MTTEIIFRPKKGYLSKITLSNATAMTADETVKVYDQPSGTIIREVSAVHYLYTGENLEPNHHGVYLPKENSSAMLTPEYSGDRNIDSILIRRTTVETEYIHPE